MYGLLLVEPEKGLPKVDKEFYVVQGDFYTAGKTGEKGMQAFSMDKARAEQPTYVKFNALSTPGNMKVNVGEKVPFICRQRRPNLTSAFHVMERYLTQYTIRALVAQRLQRMFRLHWFHHWAGQRWLSLR